MSTTTDRVLAFNDGWDDVKFISYPTANGTCVLIRVGENAITVSLTPARMEQVSQFLQDPL